MQLHYHAQQRKVNDMLKFHAHDTVNDIALIETDFCFWVRYGLETIKCKYISEALFEYDKCLSHALTANGVLK